MSKYIAKGKFVQYKNTIENFNISERAILQAFISEMQVFLNDLVLKHVRATNENTKSFFNEFAYDIGEASIKNLEEKTGRSILKTLGDDLLRDSTEEKRNELKCKGISKEAFEREFIIRWGLDVLDKHSKKKREFIKTEHGIDMDSDLGSAFLDHMAARFFSIKAEKGLFTEVSEAANGQYETENKTLLKVKSEQITKLQKRKEELITEKKNYRRNAIKMEYGKEEVQDATEDMENSIKLIDEEISELSDTTDMEAYIARLPEVLSKTFELLSNTVRKPNTKEVKDDLLKLIELTTFELSVNNQKELKVELFGVLNRLVNEGNLNLDTPPGGINTGVLDNKDGFAKEKLGYFRKNDYEKKINTVTTRI